MSSNVVSSQFTRTTEGWKEARRSVASSSVTSSGLGSGGSMLGNESSSDHNHSDVNHSINKMDINGPPKLTPVSGVFRSKNKSVVRPVAFRPLMCAVLNSFRHPSSTLMMNTMRSSSPQSSDTEIKSCYGSTMSQSSSLITEDDQKSTTYSIDSCVNILGTPASYASSYAHSGGSTLNLEEIIHTPSPSDSGVEEFEAILRDKDSEINFLRETLEQNEQVIFKVYEEKEQMWLKEIRKIRDHYDHKLRATQQRLVKMEELRNNQKYQNLLERRKLHAEIELAAREKAAAQHEAKQLREELDHIRSQFEETKWKLCQKAGEISLLKSQLKDYQVGENNRLTELLSLKSQMKETRHLVEEKDDKIVELQTCLQNSEEEAYHSKQKLEQLLQRMKTQTQATKVQAQVKSIEELIRETESLRLELSLSKQELHETKENIEEEKMHWLEEKEKVIKYQKQLQLNYVQMYRRNRFLESEVEKLKGELSEKRTNKALKGESNC